MENYEGNLGSRNCNNTGVLEQLECQQLDLIIIHHDATKKNWLGVEKMHFL